MSLITLAWPTFWAVELFIGLIGLLVFVVMNLSSSSPIQGLFSMIREYVLQDDNAVSEEYSDEVLSDT